MQSLYTEIPNDGESREGGAWGGLKQWFSVKYLLPLLLSASVIYLCVETTGGGVHMPRVVTVPSDDSFSSANFVVYETSEYLSDEPMRLRSFQQSSSLAPADASTVRLQTNVLHQKVEGFGVAFTEASAVNFFQLPKEEQNSVIDLYFGEAGINLSMGRIHINSCDFSPASYSFDDVAGDFSLEHFDYGVTHDQEKMIPMVKLAMRAMEARGAESSLKLVASPWSPPAWMKVPGKDGKQSMMGSDDAGGLMPGHKYYQAWSGYITKWVQAYADSGVPVWAVTPQNEPEFAAPWEACKWNATGESNWVNEYLGPTLKAAFPDVKILAFDHNKDHLLAWTKEVIGNDKANWVDGMAFHWYSGVSRVMDGAYGYENVAAASNFAPGKLLINTEACSCPGTVYKLTTGWFRAERLAHDIMYDLLHNAHGWISWNLLVDHAGGPNHLNNFCDAPMATLDDFSGVIVQPQFHYLGAFSKFVPPGSTRILTEVRGSFSYRGEDANMQPGLELGMYPCEQSGRQQYRFNSSEGGIMTTLRPSESPEPQYEGQVYRLCVTPGAGGDYREYVRLIDCDVDVDTPVSAQIVVHSESETTDGIVKLISIVDINTEKCLTISPSLDTWGALLIMDVCGADAMRQQFTLTSRGELVAVAQYAKDYCVTSGWPLFSAIGFRDTSDRNVVVVMNEADVSTIVSVSDDSGREMHFDSPPHSIQTVVYDRM